MVKIRRFLWLKVLLIISIILITGLFYRISGHLNNYIIRGMNNVMSLGVRITTLERRLLRINNFLKRIYYNFLYSMDYEVIILHLNKETIFSLSLCFKSKSINIHSFSWGSCFGKTSVNGTKGIKGAVCSYI